MKAASNPQRALIAAIADLVDETGRPAILGDAATVAELRSPRDTSRACMRHRWLDRAETGDLCRWTVTAAGYAQIGREMPAGAR